MFPSQVTVSTIQNLRPVRITVLIVSMDVAAVRSESLLPPNSVQSLATILIINTLNAAVAVCNYRCTHVTIL